MARTAAMATPCPRACFKGAKVPRRRVEHPREKEAKLPSILKAKTHEPELMYDDLRACGEGGTLEALSSVETGIPIRGK